MATLSLGDRQIKQQPLRTSTFDEDTYVRIYNSDGDEMSISYTDLVTALDTLFLTPSDVKLYYGTSANTLTISGGTQTFDTQSGLAYIVGQRVRITYAQDYYMEGVITSYSGNTMVVDVDYRTGSGSYNQWTISPSTEQRVPEGGSSGQVLTKSSATSYDVGWATPSGGGGSSNSDYNNSFFLMGA